MTESSETVINMKKNYVYDLETYQNLFCGVFNTGGEETVFEISARKNQYDEMMDFYNPQNIKYAIGFNNVKFDAQVMHYLTLNREKFKDKPGSELTKIIYEFVQNLIEKTNNNEFPPYAEWHFKVQQIDLFLINHYNNKNKMTSLKWVEFQIDHDKVQDLPYKFNRPLKEAWFDEVIDYCKNDVRATRAFAEKSRDLIQLRLAQDKQYPSLNLLNKSDSSVGEAIFLDFMSDAMNVDSKELKQKRTHRGSMDVKDLMLPYINFKTPEFQELLDFYKSSKSGGIQKTIVYQGLKYEFGEGGIHASWENRIFESNDEYVIVDWDVN